MRQEITAAMASWPDGDQIDLVEEMFTLTTTIALRALFSSHLGPARAELLRRAFDTFLRGIYTRTVLPLAGRLPTPGNRRYTRAVAAWRTQVSDLIEAYRRTGADRGDLMSVFSPYILHRRPDLHPHPTRFDPARWLTPAPGHRASYLPFGAGPTRCIGEEFGLAEATLILATTAVRWNLSPDPGTPISRNFASNS
jgi:cytochrome P450